ncbi:unnamed protein product [Phytomonas sp. EM1]|nr:unnamed protein product [Phytomonas sp. EM1]|eukprot:CCW62964.1 unnamed protein product [Phytomonas sp. isolate EM1]
MSVQPPQILQPHADPGISISGSVSCRILHDSTRSTKTQGAEKESGILESILFLVGSAERFEAQGNLAESVKSDETALMLRKAHEQAIAQETLKAGFTATPSTRKAVMDGLLTTLGKHATAVILRCNRYAVAEFQCYRYETAFFFLRKALFLTSENEAELREATLKEFGADPESFPSTDSEMESSSITLSSGETSVNAMNKTKRMNPEETPGQRKGNTDIRYRQTDSTLASPPNLFTEDEADERIRLRAATFNNLGCLERQRGRLEASLKYFYHTLHLQLSLLSLRVTASLSDLQMLSYRTAVASTCLNTCNVLHILGRYAQAVLACERAVQTLRSCPLRLLDVPHNKVASGDLPPPPPDAGVVAEMRIAAVLMITGLHNLGVSLRRRGEAGDAESAKLADAEAYELCKRYGLLNQDYQTVEAALKALKNGTNSFSKIATQPSSQRGTKTAAMSMNSTKEDLDERTRNTTNAPKTLPAPFDAANSGAPAAPKEHKRPATPKQDSVMRTPPRRASAAVPHLKLSLLQSTSQASVHHSQSSLPSLHDEKAASIRSRDPLPDPIVHSAVKNDLLQRSIPRIFPAPPPVLAPLHNTPPPPLSSGKAAIIPWSTTQLSLSSVPALPTLFAKSTPPRRTSNAVSSLGVNRLTPLPASTATEALPTVPNSNAYRRDPLGRRIFASIQQAKSQKPSASMSLVSEISLSQGVARGTSFATKRDMERAQAARAKRLQEKIRRDVHRRQIREQNEHDTKLSEGLYEEMVNKTKMEELQRFSMAAVQIQRVWRGVMARVWLRTVVKAVVTLQKVVRIFLVKQRERYRILAEEQAVLRAEREKRETIACIVIQARARIFLRRLGIRRTILAERRRHFMAARVIQRGYRDYLRRREAMRAAIAEANRREDEIRQFRRKTAVRCIWRAFSHYRAQKDEEEARALLQHRQNATVRIQALFRGVLTRAWFHYYRAYCRDQFQRSAISQRRLTIIQAACRALLAGRHCRSRCLQLMYEAHQRRLNNEATRIQCLWRRRVAITKFERLQAEKNRLDRRATVIQRWYRMCLIRREYIAIRDAHRQERAARKIQAWLRACWEERKAREFAEYHAELLRKQRLERLRAESIIVLQSCCKARLSEWLVASMRRTYFKHEHIARTWQRVAEGYIARKKMAREKELHAALLRKETELAIQTAAARILQRAWRYALANMKVEQRRREVRAVSLIARIYRINVSRKQLLKLRNEKEFQRQQHAARIIQQAYRGMRKCRTMEDMVTYYRDQHRKKILRMRLHEAATTIQAMWRGHVTRRVMKGVYAEKQRQADAATRLQRAWRRRRFRLSLRREIRLRSRRRQRLNESAIRIQCFWRKMMAAERAAVLRAKQAMRLDKVVKIQRWWRCVLADRVAGYPSMQEDEAPAVSPRHLPPPLWLPTLPLDTDFTEENIEKELQDPDLCTRDESETSSAVSEPQSDDTPQHYGSSSNRAPCPGAVADVLNAVLSIQRVLRGVLSEREVRRRLLAQASAEGQPQPMPTAPDAVPEQHRDEEGSDEEWSGSASDPSAVVRGLFSQRAVCPLRGGGAPGTFAWEPLHLHEAATTIQRAYRAHCRAKGSRTRQVLHGAATMIQRLWRVHHRRVLAREASRREAAARLLQSHIRAWLVRRAWEHQHERLWDERREQILLEDALDMAATTIQSAWRSTLARRRVRDLRAQRDLEKSRRSYEEAAEMIQRAFRAHRRRFRAKGTGVRSICPDDAPPPPDPPVRGRTVEAP